MANQEHLDILKQGVVPWNKWRKKHPDIKPDLREAQLARATLKGAYLYKSNLSGANLHKADLRDAFIGFANLSGADLSGADLRGADINMSVLIHANMSKADLHSVNLDWADISNASLQGANCIHVSFRETNLNDADLSGTDLSDANFHKASLRGTDFSEADMIDTLFVDIDLSSVRGLATIQHSGPSEIGIGTISRSQGKIPEIFLRGAGVPDTFITYTRSLVGQRIDFYTCFISYSTKNQDFAERLHSDLQSKKVRCWFAPHDMRTGDKIRERIDDTIRLYDKLLLILSENALTSSWVEDEVEIAFEKERQLQVQGRPQTVLFPVRLDNTIFSTTTAWAKKVCKRHITNFTAWKQYDDYQKALSRLLRDLETEAKK